jgi:hypothetical protein
MKSKPKPNTYGSLFAYLENHQQDSRSTDPHFLTRRFLSEHHLKYDRIIEVLEGFGGFDDLEVVLNVVGKIDPNTSLWAEVETPMEYALRHRLFLYTDDNGWSEPDLNLATLMMLGERHG